MFAKLQTLKTLDWTFEKMLIESDKADARKAEIEKQRKLA